MAAQSPAELGATDWWDTAYGLDAGAGTWAGTLQGRVMQGFGKPFPGLITDGDVSYDALNFTQNTGIRTPLDAGLSATFAGDFTQVILAKLLYGPGNRILCAGRAASWNDLGYGVITMGADPATANQLYGQMYDYGGSNAITLPTVTEYALFALRKVGTTLQIAVIRTNQNTVTSSGFSGTAPNVTDAQYWSVGNHHSSTSQGVNLRLFQGGFFPSVLTDQQLLNLRDAVAPWVPHPITVTVEPNAINGVGVLSGDFVKSFLLSPDAFDGVGTIGTPILVNDVTLNADSIDGVGDLSADPPLVNLALPASPIDGVTALTSSGLAGNVTLIPASPPIRGRTIFTNPIGGLVNLVHSAKLSGVINGSARLAGDVIYRNRLVANQIFAQARIVQMRMVRSVALDPLEIP